MLARRFTTILPQMTLTEATETNLTHSVAGRTGDRTTLVTACPCRLHIHASGYGADRRGAGAAAGEVVLAHHGVLFLDELPECRQHVLEVLCQPSSVSPPGVPARVVRRFIPKRYE
jgi:magnesium chelatase family protein